MKTSANNRKYGWKKDLPDNRDFVYKPKNFLSNIVVPCKVDLRKQCSAIDDQGQLGSCTANALAGHLEFLEIKEKTTYQDASRLFIYYNERVIEEDVNEDAGAALRDGIKSLSNEGWCDEKLWPYDISKFTVKPPVDAYLKATEKKISSYHRLDTLQDMLACLAEGYPFVFGITVFESFESSDVANNGVVPMPDPAEKSLGGHAVMAVGYNKKTKRFTVRNSWGKDWGQSGYFTIPFEYVTKLGDDYWTIRK